MPAQSRNVLSSYRALKHMFIGCGLMPRLVAMRPAGYGLDTVLKSLSQCAMHHLHAEPLSEQFDPLQPRQLQRWALQCLEHSETVCAPPRGRHRRIFRPFFIACCVEPLSPCTPPMASWIAMH